MNTLDAVLVLRSALKEELATTETKLRSESNDIYGKVDRLRKFATEIKLAGCLTHLFYVLTFVGRTAPTQFREKTLCEVTEHSQQKVSFLWNGRSFSLRREDLGKHPFRSDFSGASMLEQREYFAARLSLTADEVDVMSLEITVEKGYGEFEPIRNETVDVAWLKPGAWIADVLEWRERYESSVQNEVLARKYAPGVIAELKAKYGL